MYWVGSPNLKKKKRKRKKRKKKKKRKKRKRKKRKRKKNADSGQSYFVPRLYLALDHANSAIFIN